MDAPLGGKVGTKEIAHALPFATREGFPVTFSNGRTNHQCEDNTGVLLDREQGRNFSRGTVFPIEIAADRTPRELGCRCGSLDGSEARSFLSAGTPKELNCAHRFRIFGTRNIHQRTHIAELVTQPFRLVS